MADFVSKALAKSTTIIGLILGTEPKKSAMSWSLYDSRGRRKYLVPEERWAFLRIARRVGGEVGTFCAVLAYCGPRISEALALTPERIDDGDCTINFETLKRRKRGVIRTIPVPRKLLEELERVHRYRSAQRNKKLAHQRLWTWSRTTAWRRVKEVALRAGIPTYLCTPKALRHAFGVFAELSKVGLTLIKKWMGHAKLETTEIYTTVIGEEERFLARLTWKRSPPGYRR
jgi:integrase